MLNNAITVDTPTSTGGKVLTGNAGIKMNGKDVSVVGDIASCACGAKSCRGQGPILQGSPRNIILNGRPIAVTQDPVDTGCGNCFVLSSGEQVSLGGQTSSGVNLGSGVNIGNGVNINIGGGVNIGGASPQAFSRAASSSSSVSSSVSNATAVPSSSVPQINPNNMYWPPYNFLAKEGEKEIHVRYTQDTVEATVLAPEEWKEFFDMLDKTQNIGGAITGTYDAFDTAKKLGGLGVTAYVRTHNGVDYIVLKGYKQHMKTLLAGTRFRASNPQVVKLGLGALDSVKGMTRYVKVTAPMEILVGSSINVLKYVLDDEYTLKDLGVDEAKLLINILAVAGTALAIGTLAVPTTVVGTAMILVSASLFIWTVDQATDFENKLVNLVLENFDD